MTDFEGNELEIGDYVIIAYNRYQTTKLKRGYVKKVDIKQVNMLMALVDLGENSVRVASWNISKVIHVPKTPKVSKPKNLKTY